MSDILPQPTDSKKETPKKAEVIQLHPEGGSDLLTVLTTLGPKLAKTITPGDIRNYDNAKFFRVKNVAVRGVADIFTALGRLNGNPRRAIIRGRFVGEDANKTERQNDYFEEVARRWVCLDIDDYRPEHSDPVLEPEKAIGEFLAAHLPEAQGIDFAWQLSNSAGTEKYAGVLKVHVWFWLTEPATNAQLKAVFEGVPVDTSLFQQVQLHYTAAPVLEGVPDPVPVRLGFSEGFHSSELDLSTIAPVPVAVLEKRKPTKAERIDKAAEADPIARRLHELGMVKSSKAGALNIVCPFVEDHSSESGESSTQYMLANFNGFSEGRFKCLHAHCVDRDQKAFIDKMDPSLIAGMYFDDNSDEEDAAQVKDRVYTLKTIAECMADGGGLELIEDILPAAGTVCIYGQSGSGKTFLAIDLMMAVALGKPEWFGHRVMPRPVVYVALEGQQGLYDRLMGYASHEFNELPPEDQFRILDQRFCLNEAKDRKALVEAVRVVGFENPVVVIDTLTRATPGMDLNGPADMGAAIDAIDRIQRELGGLVISIYHSTIKNNNDNNTELGHSSYRGSLDASIFVQEKDGVKRWTTVKAKDSEDGVSHPFRLIPYEVRKNQWGNPKTSCAVGVPVQKLPEGADDRERREQTAMFDYLVDQYRNGLRLSKEMIRTTHGPKGMTRDAKMGALNSLLARDALKITPHPDNKNLKYIHPEGLTEDDFAKGVFVEAVEAAPSAEGL